MESTIIYNEKILKRDTSALLLIDIQEKILLCDAPAKPGNK